MDLSGNAELQQIFREEVAERAQSLVDGSRAMQAGDLPPADIVDRRRDAHTIKGNALVMGYPHMAAASKLLEDLLRDVEGGQRNQSPGLGVLVEAVAEQFLPAVEAEAAGVPEALNRAADRLRIFLGLAPLDPDPSPGDHPTPDSSPASTPEHPTTESGPDGNRASEHAESLPSDQSAEVDNVVAMPGESNRGPIEEPADLGGLVAALENQVGAEVTRVESAKMYRLINRIVELRLDADAVIKRLSGESSRAVRLADSDDEWVVAVGRLDQAAQQLEAEALDLASSSLLEVTRSFPQLVTFLARRTGKEVRLEIIGDEIEVDRQIVDALREPLRHLVVNAVDHGIEMPAERAAAGKPATATLMVRAEIDDNLLTISVTDDGRGIDWDLVRRRAGMSHDVSPDEVTAAELSRMLFTREFSTLVRPDEISGDGSGLAAAAELVQSLNGSISLETSEAGTTISMTLPSSLALQQLLVVDVGNHRWGIPETSVLAVKPVDGDVDEVDHGGSAIAVTPFAFAAGVPGGEPPTAVVVVATRVGPRGFSVGRVVESRRVVVKALGPMVSGAPSLAGAAFLGGGEVVVVVAPDRLLEDRRSDPPQRRPKVLVVDDSPSVRQLVEATLSSHGFDITLAADAKRALEALETGAFEALIVDYRMPGPDGIELVRQARKMLPGLPVVMVSAVAEIEDQNRAYAAGVDAYLDKSDFREGVLATTLRGLLADAGNEVAQ